MRLKGLGRRAYNIMHHTHMVTGMMISIILFVIFYAGAFSLFRAEIYQWENQQARFNLPETISYQRVAEEVADSYDLHAQESLRIFPAHADHPYIEIHGTVNKADGSTEHMHAHMDPRTYKLQDGPEHQTVVSQLLFRLHYLDQIPVAGLYISGFVALFFLLATVSGVLIHWQNIVQKFYAFFVGKRWKQIWTDAHTVLGVVSLPFQLMYAISGALFGLSLLLLLPSVMVMFGGDQDPVLSIIRPELSLEFKQKSARANMISVDDLKQSVANKYPNYSIHEISLKNY